MAYVYVDKNKIAPIGVTEFRKVTKPITLKITLEKSGDDINVTDNFPDHLTVDNIFGAVVIVDNKTTHETVYQFADVVCKHADGNIYFDLGTTHLYYDVTANRVKFA